MKEFTTAVEEAEREEAGEDAIQPVKFKLDGREMTANPPTDGQLVFIMAAMGRGQSNQQRMAAMVNIMMEVLDPEDQDYFEGRLITRDKKEKIGFKTIEAVFEHIVEQWFGTPTEGPSDSASSSQTDGP